MMEPTPLVLADLPESTITYWYLREGEPLTPGPFVSLRTQEYAYTLAIPGTELFLQGSILQRIVSGEGVRVTRDSCLAMLLPAAPAKSVGEEPFALLPVQDQVVPFHFELYMHRASLLHRTLMLRSDRYRRWYRRFYPLCALGETTLALCLILGTWFLLQSLILLSGSVDPSWQPERSWFVLLNPWLLLVALLCFVLRLLLAGFRVFSLERERRRWIKNSPGSG